jgi:hypothetical protein
VSELALVKTAGVFIPGNDETTERMDGYKAGDLLIGEFRKVRNPKFLRKFFALLDIGFDAWEPGEITTTWGIPEKNPKQFREQVTVLAGFYVPTYNIDGSVRLKARSISFAKMDEDEFSDVYSAVANVLLRKVLIRYTREDLDRHVEQILRFV